MLKLSPFDGSIPRKSFEDTLSFLGNAGKKVLLATLHERMMHTKDIDFLDCSVLERNLEILVGPVGARLITRQAYINADSRRSGLAAN